MALISSIAATAVTGQAATQEADLEDSGTNTIAVASGGVRNDINAPYHGEKSLDWIDNFEEETDNFGEETDQPADNTTSALYVRHRADRTRQQSNKSKSDYAINSETTLHDEQNNIHDNFDNHEGDREINSTDKEVSTYENGEGQITPDTGEYPDQTTPPAAESKSDYMAVSETALDDGVKSFVHVDANGREIETEIYPTGEKVSAYKDDEGNVVAVAEEYPDGTRVGRQFDEQGNVVETVVSPDKTIETSTYTAEGYTEDKQPFQKVVIDEDHNKTTTLLEEDGSEKVIDAVGNITIIKTDENGNRVGTTTNAEGEVIGRSLEGKDGTKLSVEIVDEFGADVETIKQPDGTKIETIDNRNGMKTISVTNPDGSSRHTFQINGQAVLEESISNGVCTVKQADEEGVLRVVDSYESDELGNPKDYSERSGPTYSALQEEIIQQANDKSVSEQAADRKGDNTRGFKKILKDHSTSLKDKKREKTSQKMPQNNNGSPLKTATGVALATGAIALILNCRKRVGHG